jgi:alpha-pyrone synthase
MVAQISQKTHQPAITSFSSFASPSTIQSFNLLETVQSKRVLATIESIATGTPDHVIRQSDAAKVVANLPSLDQNRARIEKIYTNTQIDTRHLAVDLLSDDAIAFSRTPSNIQARMQLYKEQAIPLAEQVARQALERASQHSNSYCPISPISIEESIRLIVFVSSTGFVGPGVDAALIDRLGLRRDISRVTVNFMGCAAAMNGLRVASDHVRANPTHKALVICLELSSVNAVFEDDLNDVIIHSIFGDGCAAVVVGASEEHAIAPGQVVIREHLSYLIENTEDGIILGINDNGITCRLSRQLPDYIENGVEPVIQQFLTQHDLTKADIDLWAIHPGGTRIIQKAQQSLGLSDRQVETSWEILRHYGNMLSASVLFVLEQMLFTVTQPHSDLAQDSLTGLAFSFSPGVGIEGLLFQKV